MIATAGDAVEAAAGGQGGEAEDEVGAAWAAGGADGEAHRRTNGSKERGQHKKCSMCSQPFGKREAR